MTMAACHDFDEFLLPLEQQRSQQCGHDELRLLELRLLARIMTGL